MTKRTLDSHGNWSRRVVGRVVTGIAAGAWLLTSLAPVTAAQEDDPLSVVTSFSVLADIVRNVGGDQVEVSSLVPVGGDAHTFDPSPDQIATLAEADLVVEVGNDFEPWLDDLVESSGTSATRFEAFPEGHEHEGEHANATPSDEHDHDQEGDDHDHADLHAWLNVHNTIHAVGHLAEVLAEIDPDHAGAYQANAESYTAELESLDGYITEEAGTLPEDRRLLITTHNSFGAFADAYGFEVVGVLLESHSTEGADASASHVAELTDIIDAKGIPAIFPDTPGGADMLRPVADEAGIEVAPQLYVDTLGEEGSGAETYIGMMRHNIDTIIAALGR